MKEMVKKRSTDQRFILKRNNFLKNAYFRGRLITKVAKTRTSLSANFPKLYGDFRLSVEDSVLEACQISVQTKPNPKKVIWQEKEQAQKSPTTCTVLI